MPSSKIRYVNRDSSAAGIDHVTVGGSATRAPTTMMMGV